MLWLFSCSGVTALSADRFLTAVDSSDRIKKIILSGRLCGMRRLFAGLLTLVMAVSVCGCFGSGSVSSKQLTTYFDDAPEKW